jgi:hypothetical protein
MTTRTISLLGQLQRDYDKEKENYSINSSNQEKAMYFLGRMDGIEAAIKQVAIYESEAN